MTVFGPWSQLLEICGALAKDRAVTKASSGYWSSPSDFTLIFICEDNQWYFSFLVWRKFDITLLAGGSNTREVSGELCCPLTPEQPVLLCFSILSSLIYPWLCWLGTVWLWAVMLRRALALFILLHIFWCGDISLRDYCFLFWFRYHLSSSAIYAVPNTGGQEVQSWRWRNRSGLVLHVSQWHHIC